MRRTVLAAVLLVMVAGCGGTTLHRTSSGSPATTSSTSSSSTSGAKVGDTVNVSDGTVIVHAFTPGTGTVVVADVEQCGGNANPLWWELDFTDHRTVTPKLGGASGQLALGDLAPGDCARGNVAFDVPAGETPAAVVYAKFGETKVPFAVP